MKVQLTTARVGPVSTDSDGDVIDVSADEARRLIRSGQAVEVQGVVETQMRELPVSGDTVVETNMASPAIESTNRRTPKARPR